MSKKQKAKIKKKNPPIFGYLGRLVISHGQKSAAFSTKTEKNPYCSHEAFWAELLEAWLALTSVKYHDNLLVLMLLNQWLTLTWPLFARSIKNNCIVFHPWFCTTQPPKNSKGGSSMMWKGLSIGERQNM